MIRRFDEVLLHKTSQIQLIQELENAETKTDLKLKMVHDYEKELLEMIQTNERRLDEFKIHIKDELEK